VEHRNYEKGDAGKPRSKRVYSPIGLTITSNDLSAEFGGQIVSSVKIIAATPEEPIPVSDGYTFVYVVPNANISGVDELGHSVDSELHPDSFVYVLVKTDPSI